MIYCPRCDKRITPDHRCLSRRHFFGMLAGAALLVAPKPALPFGHPIQVTEIADGRPIILHAGDRISFRMAGYPVMGSQYSLAVTFGEGSGGTFVGSCGEGPLFVAPEALTITHAAVRIGNVVHRAPIEITRSGQ